MHIQKQLLRHQKVLAKGYKKNKIKEKKNDEQ